MSIEMRKTPEELKALHRHSLNEATQLEPGVMVTQRNWNAVIEMQNRQFHQQLQLDADLRLLLTRQDALAALEQIQLSTNAFAKQAGSLSERYSSGCKALTDSTNASITSMIQNFSLQLSSTVQEAKKKIRLCAWISITTVILCAMLCVLAVLWSR